MKKERRTTRYWAWCCGAAWTLVIITFTPLVIPAGRDHPALFGIPYSLWTSFIITVLLVALTWLGSRVYPRVDEGGETPS